MKSLCDLWLAPLYQLQQSNAAMLEHYKVVNMKEKLVALFTKEKATNKHIDLNHLLKRPSPKALTHREYISTGMMSKDSNGVNFECTTWPSFSDVRKNTSLLMQTKDWPDKLNACTWLVNMQSGSNMVLYHQLLMCMQKLTLDGCTEPQRVVCITASTLKGSYSPTALAKSLHSYLLFLKQKYKASAVMLPNGKILEL